MSSEMVYSIPHTKEVEQWIQKAIGCIECFEQPLKGMCIETYLLNLAKKFLEENPWPRHCNFYSLTKYLGERFVYKLSNYTIARLTNIYGPGYIKDRMIPRIIRARMLGKTITEVNTSRDYVYIDDLNESLYRILIQPSCDSAAKIVDFKSGCQVDTRYLKNKIYSLLPTLYGEIVVYQEPEITDKCMQESSCIPSQLGSIALIIKRSPIPLLKGLENTVCYYQSNLKCDNQHIPRTKFYLNKSEKFLRFITGGGSSSHLVLIKNFQLAKIFVRKISLWDGVEGNGIPKLKNELIFLRYLRNKSPILREVYPAISKYCINNSEFVYYDMPYINGGENLITSLSNSSIQISHFLKLLGRLFSIIIENGYVIDGEEISLRESLDTLHSLVFNRGMARAMNLFSYNCGVKMYWLQKDVITINRVEYINPLKILMQMSKDAQIEELLRPRYRGMCVHGDLTFLNAMISDDKRKIMLIDPRGQIEKLDCLYDFGKMKFSLSGFSSVMNGRYLLENDPSGVRIKLINFSNVAQVDRLFIPFLSGNKSFSILKQKEPFWNFRIQVYQAVHYLADIPFRLSRGSDASDAVACYLLGTIYLNHIYAAIQAYLTQLVGQVYTKRPQNEHKTVRRINRKILRAVGQACNSSQPDKRNADCTQNARILSNQFNKAPIRCQSEVKMQL